MGKKEMVSKMAKVAGITLRQAESSFEALVKEIQTSLKAGKRVTFSGFGSFEVKMRKPRKGRNPKTGESISIPTKKRIKFNPSRSFKNSL
ncbi:MAG: HU family DNA-binding protein [Candidatus Aminicenantales bacterium]